MQITFLGTRGYIDITSRRHKWHASTLLTYRGKRIMIDCGLDWTKKVWSIKPDAIVITHAHPDHAWGLKYGSPCPVYATEQSWDLMSAYPIKDQYLLEPRKPVMICGLLFETFPVIHSLRAPAVGYRITAGTTIIFVAHDIIAIEQRHAALKDAQLYIGDGASITRPIIRSYFAPGLLPSCEAYRGASKDKSKNGKLFGHTTIRAQLGWCEKEGVPRAIFTHCGSQIVGGDGRVLNAQVRKLGLERGVEATVAYDGMEIVL